MQAWSQVELLLHVQFTNSCKYQTQEILCDHLCKYTTLHDQANIDDARGTWSETATIEYN